MKKILTLSIAVLLACASAFAQKVQVGAAKVDITPTKEQLKLSIDSIRGKLYVKAIYVTDGTTPIVIASIDGNSTGMGDIVKKSSQMAGVPEENYLFTGTHTHSGNTRSETFGGGFPTRQTIEEAFIKAVNEAKAHTAPARVCFGKTALDLNVNRDNYNSKQEWEQEPNWTAPSDKDLTVLSFVGDDDVPIAVYMNYAMHPVNFFQSGVTTPDFPGDACDFIEDVFDGKTVALFSQGASGDQNPKLAYTSVFKDEPRKAFYHGKPDIYAIPETPEEIAAREKSNHLRDEYAHMLGTSIGFAAIKIMHYDMKPEADTKIWAGKTTITCPGRERLDNEGRENYDPGYKDAADVHIGVGVMKIGDIDLVSVSGEIYSEIGQRIKRESPSSKTMVVSLAEGPFESGYIYSDNAAHHLTFQVVGSRLKPGYAETGIVNAALDLLEKAKSENNKIQVIKY